MTVTLLSERLAMPRLKFPTSLDRRLLAYLHSGEVMRHFLPKLLRISAVMELISYAILWIFVWPLVYQEFERWGLVKAFVAQWIALATMFLQARISLLRAKHLEALPGDDYVILRAVSVLCRWYAEISIVYVLGMGLSAFLQPLSPYMMSLLNAQSGAVGGANAAFMSMFTGAVSALYVLLVGPMFIFLYTIATAIDLSLAIEFNTRAEKAGRGSFEPLR